MRKSDSLQNTESKCTLEDEDPHSVVCSHEHIQTLIETKTNGKLYYLTKCWRPLVIEFRNYVFELFNPCIQNYTKLKDLRRIKIIARYARDKFGIPKRFLNKKGLTQLVNLLHLNFFGNSRLQRLYD